MQGILLTRKSWKVNWTSRKLFLAELLSTRNRVPEFGTELPGRSQHTLKSKCSCSHCIKTQPKFSKEAVRALKPCWLNVVLVIYNDCIVTTTSIHESNCDKRAILYGHFAPKKAQYQSSRSQENSFCRSITSWWQIGWWRIFMVAKWP